MNAPCQNRRITREGALRAFLALRAGARANGVSDLSKEEINE